jgi:hypothetical protein
VNSTRTKANKYGNYALVHRRYRHIAASRPRHGVAMSASPWLVPCEHCGLTWLKHPLACPNYRAIDKERCMVQHSMFLRSCGGGQPYVYECNMCSLPPIEFAEEQSFPMHPWCVFGHHVWETPCCGSDRSEYCFCGAIKPLDGALPAC